MPNTLMTPATFGKLAKIWSELGAGPLRLIALSQVALNMVSCPG